MGSIAVQAVRQMEELMICSYNPCNCTIICCRENCLAAFTLLISTPAMKTSLIK